MALARKQFTVTDDGGNVVPSASVEVRDEATASLVQLYSDRAGAAPIGNPVTADSEGFVAFHCVGGAYKITATSGAFTREWRYVGIGLLQESDTVEDAAAGQLRTKLTEDTTYVVVAATGNDTTGDGTLALPFATPQGAYDFLLANIDAAGFFIKVRMNDSSATTYTATDKRRTTDEFSADHTVLTLNANIPNCPCIEFEAAGQTGPDYSTNRIKWDADGGNCIFCAAVGGLYRFQGIAFVDGSGGADFVFQNNNSTISFNSCDFGATTGSYHIHSGPGVVKIFGDYSISGGAALAHMFIEQLGAVDHEISTVTITNTPDFATGFLWIVAGAEYSHIVSTYSGSATGPKYRNDGGTLGSSAGSNDDVFPGDEPGVTFTTGNGDQRMQFKQHSIADGANAIAFEGAGLGSLVQLIIEATGASGLFFITAGNVVNKLSGDANWQVSTTPSGGNCGFNYDGSNYRIYNNTGVTRSIFLNMSQLKV